MLHMNYNRGPHSDLDISVRSHLFKNGYELFHVKTSLRELNKNIDSYVFSQLSNNEHCGTIQSSLHGPLTRISFTSNCLKRMECSLCTEI